MEKDKAAEKRAMKTREQRLAAQLRANLARRKLQARVRRAEENTETAEKKSR